MTAEQPLSIKTLQTRYPYQFSNPVLGIAVTKGWLPILTQLCAELDPLLGNNKRGFHWTQIKEKFGYARFYYQFDGRQPDARLDILTPTGLISQAQSFQRRVRSTLDRELERLNAEPRQLVLQAEQATQKACLVCGQAGDRDPDGGYLLVLCPEHRAPRTPSGEPSPSAIWGILEPAQNLGEGA